MSEPILQMGCFTVHLPWFGSGFVIKHSGKRIARVYNVGDTSDIITWLHNKWHTESGCTYTKDC